MINPTQNLHKNADISVFDEFNAWVEQERAAGLVDMKFAIESNSATGTSTRKILEELMRAEKMIVAGIIEPHLSEEECTA